MKKLFAFSYSLFLPFVISLNSFACHSGDFGKKLLGKWSRPEIEMRLLFSHGMNSDEKKDRDFILDRLKNRLGNMQIEYFDDRTGSPDTYQMSLAPWGGYTKESGFGEYEVLADGKRLLLHLPDSQLVNIVISNIGNSEQQWRLRYSDMMKLAGHDMDLPDDLPDCAMYLTFKKED